MDILAASADAARSTLVLTLWSAICACGGGSTGGLVPVTPPISADDRWAELRDALETHSVDDLALIVGIDDGEVFRFEKGDFRIDDSHSIASASKWLTGATILQLVEQGVMSLDDSPSRHLDYWTDDPGDPRSRITLAQLLSFTAGFHSTPIDPTCIGDSSLSLQACVQTFYENGLDAEPGTTYFYGPIPMQVAAAMAEATTGQSWTEIVELTLALPLGLANTGFAPPHPRASGSATSTARDYARFLAAQLDGGPLEDSFLTLADDRLTGVEIVYRPGAFERNGLDWHYGLGAWRECAQAVWDTPCEARTVVSSAMSATTVLAVDETPTFFDSPAETSILLGELQRLIEAALATP